MTRRIGLFALALIALPHVADACSLCGAGTKRQATLREEARFAKIVVVGTLENPRLTGGQGGLSSGAATDVRIRTVLQGADALGGRKTLTVPRYIPVSDPKNPPTFLVFCDVYDGKLDPYRGTPITGDGIVPYLKGSIAHGETTDVAALEYYFRHLDSETPEIAADAFLEFAKADDRAVGEVAEKLDPAKLRQLLKTAPVERLGVFAFLLGACGGEPDAELLRQMIADGTARSRAALGGLLGGYIALKPTEGWDLLVGILADPKKPFNEKLSVINAVRFFRGWKAEETKPQVRRAMKTVVEQGDLADLAVEDLRRWEQWDLTPTILAQFGKESHDAPIVRRAIVRYAISCPNPAATAFVAALRKTEPELVKELEENLAFEKDDK